MKESVDECDSARRERECLDDTSAAVWRLVQLHGPSHLTASLTSAIDISARLDEMTVAVEEVNSELVSQVRPELAEFMRVLKLGLAELRFARWKEKTVQRLGDLWRRTDRVREQLSTASGEDVCSVCEDVISLAADVERLNCDTDRQLQAVGVLEQRVVCVKNELIQRLQTLWRSMVCWRSKGESVNSPPVPDDLGHGDERLRTADCSDCVELVITPHSDQQRFVSALKSLGVIDRCVEGLGRAVFDRIIRPYTLSRAGELRLRMRSRHDDTVVVVLSLQCNQCCRGGHVFPHSCNSTVGQSTLGEWRRMFVEMGEVTSLPCDEFVSRVRCISGLVSCLHETLLVSDCDLTRMMWTQCESDDTLADLLADSDLLAAAVGEVTDFSGRDLVRRLMASVSDLDVQLSRIGHPEGGRMMKSLFTSSEHIAAVNLDNEKEHVFNEESVEDVFLNLLCNNKLASIRSVLLSDETIEDDFVEIDEPPCDDTQDSGVSVEEFSDRLRSDSPLIHSSPATSDDELNSDGESSYEEDLFEKEPPVLPGFMRLLECDVLFRFPRCLVWKSAVTIVHAMETIIDLSSHWPCACQTSYRVSGGRNDLSTADLVTRQRSSQETDDVLREKSHSPPCSPSEQSFARGDSGYDQRLSSGDVCKGTCHVRSTRYRLMLCVRQILQLCCCLLEQRLSRLVAEEKEEGSDSDPSVLLLQRIALTHNSCHWISFRALQMAVTWPSHGVDVGTPSPHVLWLDSAVEVRRLAGSWLETGELLLGRCVSRVAPVSVDSCSEQQLRKCARLLAEWQEAWVPPLLPPRVSEHVLGGVAGRLLVSLCRAVLREADISAGSCDRLLSLFHADFLGVEQLPGVSSSPQWRRFCLLRGVLGGGLADVGRLWEEGSLGEGFSAEEVRHLVRALFRNTERRAALLATIR